MQTESEKLFTRYCSDNGIACERIATGVSPTPDFRITLGSTAVTCELKQIDPNPDDLQEMQAALEARPAPVARWVTNRLRRVLKKVSRQMKAACASGEPTLLVVYDNTPFPQYLSHHDVVEALFGEVKLRVFLDGSRADEQFFGGNRGLTPRHNTSVSAVAVLEHTSEGPLRLRVYHNPFAAVRLDPALLETAACVQKVLPDDTDVAAWEEAGPA